MKTYSQKPTEVTRRWVLIDAKDAPLGRLATEISKYLIGKYKPTYTPPRSANRRTPVPGCTVSGHASPVAGKASTAAGSAKSRFRTHAMSRASPRTDMQ